MANGTINQRHRFIDIKRFRQIIKGALLIGADRRVKIRMRRHYDDRKHRMALFNLL